MDQGRRLALILVVACRGDAPPPPLQPPPPIVADAALAWDDDFAAKLLDARGSTSKAYLAMKELRTSQLEGDASFPEGALPALDFTRTGNAVLTSTELFARDPLTEAARCRIVHLADDPVQLARLADGMMSSDADKATYRGARYRPVLEQLARARYAVFVAGECTPARISLGDTITDAARFDGVAYVYELATTKLLAGLRLSVTGEPGIEASKHDSYLRKLDPAVLDLEERMREALWTALRTRSPSVTPAPIAYLQIDDD